MIEKAGGLTFKDGILVSTYDGEKKIAERGGIDAMFERSLENNPLMASLACRNKDNKR